MGSLFANKKLRLHISRGVCLTEHIQPLRYLAALVAHLVPVYHQLGGFCFFLVGGGGAPSTDATKSNFFFGDLWLMVQKSCTSWYP